MITTLFMLLLIAFQLWHVTSKQVKHNHPPQYLQKIIANPRPSRIAGAVLFILATAVFVVKMGWMTGISASIVGLMGVGSLVVSLHPFHYLRTSAVIALYAFFLILEFLI